MAREARVERGVVEVPVELQVVVPRAEETLVPRRRAVRDADVRREVELLGEGPLPFEVGPLVRECVPRPVGGDRSRLELAAVILLLVTRLERERADVVREAADVRVHADGCADVVAALVRKVRGEGSQTRILSTEGPLDAQARAVDVPPADGGQDLEVR